MSVSSEDHINKKILHILDQLESRVNRIEEHLQIKSSNRRDEIFSESSLVSPRAISTDKIEFQIGEFWFAKVGIVVLAIGIAFLLTFPYQTLPAGVPILIGYSLIVGLAILSHLWKNSFELISRYLMGGALLLLYFTTLRLHYFSEKPLITGNLFEIALLLLVVIINLFISLRRKSVYLSGITITLGYITAILSERPIIIYVLLVIYSLLLVYVHAKHLWHVLLHYGILLTYFTHFLWFINNPFLTHKIQFVSSPYYNIYFIPFYALIFSLYNYFRSKGSKEDTNISLSMFLNSFTCYGLYLLLTLTKFRDYLAINHFLISIFFLLFAILFWNRERSKYATSFYALIAYAALSVSLIAKYEIPDSFVMLSWQSLLVVSTAIWFRSKFIIVSNFIIYIIIFIAYLVLSGRTDVISLSFGIVALISARILNWKKENLELKTELMRNAYLTSAFFIFPYALYHAVPKGYISLSWIGIAAFYYLLSLLLNNRKYRWMALLTFMLTALYLFAIGTINFDPIYRLISFIVLGSALLVVSILYTKVRMKTHTKDTKDG